MGSAYLARRSSSAPLPSGFYVIVLDLSSIFKEQEHVRLIQSRGSGHIVRELPKPMTISEFNEARRKGGEQSVREKQETTHDSYSASCFCSCIKLPSDAE